MTLKKPVGSGFSSRLLQLIEELGLSQRKIAEFAGVNEGSVSRWVSGSSVPEIENVMPLAARSGVSLKWLAYGEGALEPKVKDIEGYIDRARKTILPRLDSILEHLNWIIGQDWLSNADREKTEEFRQPFAERRSKLRWLLKIMEQLPADDIPAIEERLFGRAARANRGKPLVDIRTALAWFVGIDPKTATEAEILDACSVQLKEESLEMMAKECGPVHHSKKSLPKSSAKRLGGGSHKK